MFPLMNFVSASKIAKFESRRIYDNFGTDTVRSKTDVGSVPKFKQASFSKFLTAAVCQKHP